MTDPITWQVLPERPGHDGTWLLQRDGITDSTHESQLDAAVAGVECAMSEAARGVPGCLCVQALRGRVVMEWDYPPQDYPQRA